MKKVGLISDTHVPARARNLPPKVFEVFKDVELILHAGDLTVLSVVDELSRTAEVLAVHGNMDSEEVRRKLPALASVEVCGWKIGVVHDAGALFGKKRMRSLARKHGFNVLVYGHTHHTKLFWEKAVLYINPGSPTFPLPPFFNKPTVAVLKITSEKITPEVITIIKEKGIY